MLPPLNESGDLPAGIHRTNWAEVEQVFGSGTDARTRGLAKLNLVWMLAARTGKLARFLVFGSFVSSALEPRDVDVVLVMATDFKLEEAPRECQNLFSHSDADARYGASVFWIREGMMPEKLLAEFMEVWQTKRDGQKRGIIEIQK